MGAPASAVGASIPGFEESGAGAVVASSAASQAKVASFSAAAGAASPATAKAPSSSAAAGAAALAAAKGKARAKAKGKAKAGGAAGGGAAAAAKNGVPRRDLHILMRLGLVALADADMADTRIFGGELITTSRNWFANLTELRSQLEIVKTILR